MNHPVYVKLYIVNKKINNTFQYNFSQNRNKFFDLYVFSGNTKGAFQTVALATAAPRTFTF